MTGPRGWTRPPNGWWEWHGAVMELAPSEGALATAMAWGLLCVRWPKGLPELQPMSHKDFVAAHPRGFHESTVRRHLEELARAGILERRFGHSRWGSNIYEPCVPALDAEAANSAHERAVLDANSARQRAVLGFNSGRRRPVLGLNSAHLGAQQRASDDSPPFFPDLSETPSHARTHARAHAHARDAGAGRTERRSKDADRVLAAVPDAAFRTMARDELDRAGELADELLRRGWDVDDLRSVVGSSYEQGSGRGLLGDCGRALVARLQKRLDGPPKRVRPSLQIVAAAACGHGLAAGCTACPFCRQGIADGDGGLVCSDCDHGRPLGHTEASS